MKVTLLLALFTVGEGGSTKVKGRTGDNVTLPCHYDVTTHGLLYVCWVRGHIPNTGCRPLIVEADPAKVIGGSRESNRYQLLGRLDTGDVSLTILNVTHSDQGVYGCRVDVPGWFNDHKHHFDLTLDTVLLWSTPTSSSTPTSTPTSPVPSTGAHTSGHMTSAALAVLTSSSASSSVSSRSAEEVGAVAVTLLCVFFGVLVLITVGGVIIIIARKWRQRKVGQHVHLSTSLSTLQLQSRRAADNIYQLDEAVYDSCP